jgi:hypothetical protein
MKVKTSITLSERALREVDRLAGKEGSRSAVIESAVLAYADQLRKSARRARDRQLLDQNADTLNAELNDLLDFQRLP